MNLEVRIDARKMNKYIREGGELLFDIAWIDNGLYYPMDPWLDFGILVLGWWTNALLSMIRGEEDDIKLSFMDGPYYLMMKIDRSLKTLVGVIHELPLPRVSYSNPGTPKSL